MGAMARLSNLTAIWENIREVDLNQYRQAAEQALNIILVCTPGLPGSALAEQMRIDPHHPKMQTHTPLLVTELGVAQDYKDAHLVIILANSSQASSPEMILAQSLLNHGKRVLLIENTAGAAPGAGKAVISSQQAGFILAGSVAEAGFLTHTFVPAVIRLMPDHLLALGRQFPLFRVAIANHLINETCLANAAYSLTTGIGEIVPVLGIPFYITDMIVLTKSQAFLAYKLGLALGYSTSWRDYVSEFGGVIGGGFVWRQLSRSLVGLVPGWGIIPKVAIAYSGTYVVGHAILQWYLTGRHLTARQMRALSRQSFERGKVFALGLVQKAPLPRRKRQPSDLPAPQDQDTQSNKPGLFKRKRASKQLPPAAQQVCPFCGRSNAPDASFCQYCGEKLNVG